MINPKFQNSTRYSCHSFPERSAWVAVEAVRECDQAADSSGSSDRAVAAAAEIPSDFASDRVGQTLRIGPQVVEAEKKLFRHLKDS